MSLGRDYAGQECALASALELIGERWTLLLVRDAFYGVRRYSDFLAHVGAPRAVLAERLQSLVDAGAPVEPAQLGWTTTLFSSDLPKPTSWKDVFFPDIHATPGS